MGTLGRLVGFNCQEHVVARTLYRRLVNLEKYGRLHDKPFQHVQRIPDSGCETIR